MPNDTSLIGSTRSLVSPLGVVVVHAIFREGHRDKTILIEFLVVGVSLANNVISGWPTLNQLRIMVSTSSLGVTR